MNDMAKQLGLTQPALGYAVDRGERIFKKRKIEFIEWFSWFLVDVPSSPYGFH
jgi:hypothetical protein